MRFIVPVILPVCMCTKENARHVDNQSQQRKARTINSSDTRALTLPLPVCFPLCFTRSIYFFHPVRSIYNLPRGKFLRFGPWFAIQRSMRTRLRRAARPLRVEQVTASCNVRRVRRSHNGTINQRQAYASFCPSICLDTTATRTELQAAYSLTARVKHAEESRVLLVWGSTGQLRRVGDYLIEGCSKLPAIN